MKFTINNTDDLLMFIDNENVTTQEAIEVTEKYLTVYCLFNTNKKGQLSWPL